MSELLACEAARIDVGGAALFDGLDCSTSADWVVLIGPWQPLFALMARRASLVGGSVRVNGHAALDAVRDGVAGLVTADVPLPLGWTGSEYLTQSARLIAELDRRSAPDAVRAAVDVLGVPGIAARRIGTLSAAERRVLLIVHALIGAPAVLALESPLAGLDAWTQNWVLEAVLRAASGRRLLTSIEAVEEAGPERNLLDRATEILWLDGGQICAQGPPSTALGSSRRYLVTVLAHGAELAEVLERRGCAVHDALAAGARSAVLIAAGATRFVIELPDELTPDVVLGCAVDVEAPVVELVPFGAVRVSSSR